MLRYIEVTGKTEEEAVNKGLAQLGLDRDDVSVEILERPRTGFLGIGSVPAKVKLSYEGPDEVPADAPKEEPAQAPVPERPVPPVKEKTSGPRKKPEPKAPKAEAKPEPAKAAPEAQSDEVVAVAKAIEKFQAGLFKHMGVEATSVIIREGDTYRVLLEGENVGALIGHRGETLDAIQQLTSYAVNRGRSHRVRIHVDAEGYRARREESLERLARKTAARAVKYRRSITLEAMNAYERHVIHAALQDYPGVSTYSTGTEPNRRTVVAYDPNKK